MSTDSYDLPAVEELSDDFKIGPPEDGYGRLILFAKPVGDVHEMLHGRKEHGLDGDGIGAVDTCLARSIEAVFEGKLHTARNCLLLAACRYAAAAGNTLAVGRPRSVKPDGTRELEDLDYFDARTGLDLWDTIQGTVWNSADGTRRLVKGSHALRLLFRSTEQDQVHRDFCDALCRAADGLSDWYTMGERFRTAEELSDRLLEATVACSGDALDMPLSPKVKAEYFRGMQFHRPVNNREMADVFAQISLGRAYGYRRWERQRDLARAQEELLALEGDVDRWQGCAAHLFDLQQKTDMDARAALRRRNIWEMLPSCLSPGMKADLTRNLNAWWGAKKHIVAANCRLNTSLRIATSAGPALLLAVLQKASCWLSGMTGRQVNLHVDVARCVVRMARGG